MIGSVHPDHLTEAVGDDVTYAVREGSVVVCTKPREDRSPVISELQWIDRIEGDRAIRLMALVAARRLERYLLINLVPRHVQRIIPIALFYSLIALWLVPCRAERQ